MEQISWILWLVLGVGLLVAEVFTFGFVLFWFGIGAVAAAVVALAGGGLVWQLMTFIVVSAALTAASKTIFSNYFSLDEKNKMLTGIDSLPGKIGTVTQKSAGALNAAAVKVYGSIWTAFPIEGEDPLTEGEKVEVIEVKGSSIYVRRMVNELPEWRSEQ
jgi:membrane protein implicated in regulation of membrane protease activity